jgi:L,D-peptidoglycan transpeptidase YkuD (ErfK/YbiS/YcfS/YnhG family)
MTGHSRTGRRRALIAGTLVVLVLAAGCAGGGGGAARTESVRGTSRAVPVTPAITASPPSTRPPAPATTSPPAPPSTAPATRPPTTTRPVPPPTSPTTEPEVPTTSACPGNLASSLASTGSARELITVVAPGYGAQTATVEAWQRSGPCWEAAEGPWAGLIGANGFSDHHREGDDTTPTGTYGIGPVMYGNGPNPGVQEPYHQLVCGDWWDEDPGSPSYNTFQHVPCGRPPSFGGNSEALWTETGPYPSFAVVEYNTDRVIAYAGSAIFIHADTGTPTTGCVSIPLPELDQLLRWINPADTPTVVMGPASEIRSF